MAYKSSSAHGNPGSTLTLNAVSCCQNRGRVQERAAAEMLAIDLHANNEWEVSGYSGNTANDLRCVYIFIPLRNRRSGNDRQGSKAENEGLCGHDEEADRMLGLEAVARSCEGCLDSGGFTTLIVPSWHATATFLFC